MDGVDVEAPRIVEAKARHLDHASFTHFDGARLPFSDGTFDGAFVNEVLEHVDDEQAALSEVHRVLKSAAPVVVISPNRWFPLEGHVVHVGRRIICPAPLVPWLPKRLTRTMTVARNYWPHELIREVRQAGYEIVEVGYIWPILEVYPWLPQALIHRYQRHVERLDDIAVLRKFGVSTLVVGRKA